MVFPNGWGVATFPGYVATVRIQSISAEGIITTEREDDFSPDGVYLDGEGTLRPATYLDVEYEERKRAEWHAKREAEFDAWRGELASVVWSEIDDAAVRMCGNAVKVSRARMARDV